MPEINLDLADFKPSLYNVFMVFLAVLITVPVAKWAFNRWPVPGVTPLVNAL